MNCGNGKSLYNKAMDGIFVINKPAGMTSHDVIGILRKRYKQKKFGHTGTLDPNASGVLVVLAGKAAKALQFIEDTDKEYIASIQLGTSYHTDDIWGDELDHKPVNRDFDFPAVIKSFEGDLHQRVPDVSAKKVGGKTLMEYARNHQEVPEVYADVHVYEIEPLSDEDLSFRCQCSSGTYMRSICRDFGEKTGNLAAMSGLIRTKANGFSLEQAQDPDAEEHVLYPITTVLNLPQVHYEPIKDVYNGKSLHIDSPYGRILMMDKDEPIAIYDRHHKDVFSCARGLW